MTTRRDEAIELAYLKFAINDYGDADCRDYFDAGVAYAQADLAAREGTYSAGQKWRHKLSGAVGDLWAVYFGTNEMEIDTGVQLLRFNLDNMEPVEGKEE